MDIKHRLLALASFVISLTATAADPTDTNFPWSDCMGTYKPYPAPRIETQYPDSLTPLMINHVGRHGARYPSSSKYASTIRLALTKIDDAAGLNAHGKALLALTDRVIEAASGRWGSLTSLGIAEERGIASRMFVAYRPLFTGGRINAISSYSPRCIMSMYEFVHQLSRLNNKIDVTTSSGRCNSHLLRFFDESEPFNEFLKSESLAETLAAFNSKHTPTAPLARLSTKSIDGLFTTEEAQQAVAAEFALLTSLACMEMSCTPTDYFTPVEQNSLWADANLAHYLRRSASTLSTIPADIAAPLLENLIATFDDFLAHPTTAPAVQLRFGHAETLMPLLALIKLQGCYYLTNYFDTVALHWQDFHVVPMAANLQLVLFKSKKGNLYLRAELNEQPVPLIPGSTDIFVPWAKARQHLQNSLPFDFNIN